MTKFIDLTHALTPDIPCWAGDCGFSMSIESDYSDCSGVDRFRTHKVLTRAGMGTHIDAPAHCFDGENTVDLLPLENLITDCIVIDVADRVSEKLVVAPEVIADFEREHGIIPPQSFVIFHTGWGVRWSTPVSYRNGLRFPSIHHETAKLLLQRDVAGLGTDTLSADSGGRDFPVHRAILGAGKYLVENIANSEQLPAVGAKLYVLPMKIKGATEAPLRLIATIEEN